MAAKYNNGTVASVGDDVLVMGNDYATVFHGKVISILPGNLIRIDTHSVPLPVNNAIPTAAAHSASTTGIVAPTTISYQPSKKGN